MRCRGPVSFTYVTFSHGGGLREYGMAEPEMPFPLLCNLPILTVRGGRGADFVGGI
jgi:hypothetical protein